MEMVLDVLVESLEPAQPEEVAVVVSSSLPSSCPTVIYRAMGYRILRARYTTRNSQ